MIFSKHLSLQAISDEIGCSANALTEGVDFYNADFSAYGNEIYRDISSRVAHWLNFQEQDWFSKRLSYYLDNYGDYDLVIDLGYSVPYVYGRPDIAWSQTDFIFVDKYSSSEQFHKAVENLLDIDRPLDQIVIADVESPTFSNELADVVGPSSGKKVLVVGSEVVEHLNDPHCFWSAARQLATEVKELHCFVTLPIGQQIASHTMQFLSRKEAIGYLSRFIEPIHEGRLIPTQSESTPYLQSCVWALGTLKR